MRGPGQEGAAQVVGAGALRRRGGAFRREQVPLPDGAVRVGEVKLQGDSRKKNEEKCGFPGFFIEKCKVLLLRITGQGFLSEKLIRIAQTNFLRL